MADKQSEEKRALLRAYGAEVVVCPTDVDAEDERSYYKVSDRLARETPGAWKPDQYTNPANPGAHYRTTGPEIWEGAAGRITHFVCAVGTGGTISGSGRYLKERRPDLVVVGADTEGSVFSGGPVRPYLTEGIGEDFWPETYDTDVADVIVRVSDRDAFLTARAATAAEGILFGESAGTALWTALQVARDVDDPDALFVAIAGPTWVDYDGFDLAIWDWYMLLDPDFALSVLTCEQFGFWSDSGYCNEEYDALYEEQGLTVDQTARREVVHRMQEIIYEDKPYIMLQYRDMLEAHSAQWDGFLFAPLGSYNNISKLTLLNVHQVG